MEKLLFRKLITDISLRALIITFTLGAIVWIVQAVNYLDFVIDDGHNFRIYFYYNLFNFPKIVHRILPFVLFISIEKAKTKYLFIFLFDPPGCGLFKKKRQIFK